MNDTKWEEIRLAMYGLGDLSPQWRTCDVENGYLSQWDGDWFYHFRNGRYKFIELLEIRTTSVEHEVVLDALEKIHVPGEQTPNGFKVYGYVPSGVAVEYLSRFNTSPKAEATGSAWRQR